MTSYFNTWFLFNRYVLHNRSYSNFITNDLFKYRNINDVSYEIVFSDNNISCRKSSGKSIENDISLTRRKNIFKIFNN